MTKLLRCRLEFGTLVVFAAAAVTASAVAAGEGRVVVQKGIAGVRLTMTETQVKAKAGLPRKVERGRSEVGPWKTWHYRTYTVTFFAGKRVTQTTTVSANERIATGVGVGSTRAEVKAGVRSAKCLKEYGYDHCYLGNWTPGGTITDFALTSGRVTRVSIGYVID